VHRLLVHPDPQDPETFRLDPRQSRHARLSLRLRPGDVFIAFDGRGREWEAEVVCTSPVVVARLLRPRPGIVPPHRLTLYQGMPKSDKMDTIVRMGTELGIGRFVPVLMERSVKRGGRVDRWRRIAEEAAKQCRRADVPDVQDPLPFADAVAEFSGHGRRLFLWEGGGRPLLVALGAPAQDPDIGVFVGPEGGFAPEEVNALTPRAEAVTLGPLVLRTETAGIAAAAVLLAWATGREG